MVLVKTYDALRAMIRCSGNTDKDVSRAVGRCDSFIGSVIHMAKKRNGVVASETMISAAKVCGYTLAFVRNDDIPKTAITITIDGD